MRMLSPSRTICIPGPACIRRNEPEGRPSWSAAVPEQELPLLAERTHGDAQPLKRRIDVDVVAQRAAPLGPQGRCRDPLSEGTGHIRKPTMADGESTHPMLVALAVRRSKGVGRNRLWRNADLDRLSASAMATTRRPYGDQRTPLSRKQPFKGRCVPSLFRSARVRIFEPIHS
jgi:hypothetical protein